MLVTLDGILYSSRYTWFGGDGGMWCMVMAKLLVPAGALTQLRFGEMPRLSQVYSFGNVPLLVKAVLLAVKLPVVVVVVSFLQEVNKRLPANNIGKRKYFIVIF